MKLPYIIPVVFGILALPLRTLHADPAQAEDVAFRMADPYIHKTFQMAPADYSGMLTTGNAVRFLIPVVRGLDYVFLVGTDDAARDVDIYVYDEVGQLILDDRRSSKLAGVQFRSSYNGTAVVYLHMARANGLASYTVLVGRRGVAKEGILDGSGNTNAPKDEAATISPVPASPPPVKKD
ncbi:hypothetical protein [Prosthecobacter sp.]|uniref:hypothetical protein n=1 Tax=Prosthecobacter sp. TaxID=1965333 RepID=UPI002ABC6F7A|nr:hypothetical protein [Prosthecobacter sp.]MDZ4405004.1 hypothetical protein [Prosthecobacter sp.]